MRESKTGVKIDLEMVRFPPVLALVYMMNIRCEEGGYLGNQSEKRESMRRKLKEEEVCHFFSRSFNLCVFTFQCCHIGCVAKRWSEFSKKGRDYGSIKTK